MVWNYQSADWSLREKIIVIYYNFWRTFVPSRTLQWALLHHCYRRHLCSAVGLLDTSAGPAKTAEPIEMPSGWELVGMDGSQHTQSDSRGDSTRWCGLLATVTVATCYISVFLETLCIVWLEKNVNNRVIVSWLDVGLSDRAMGFDRTHVVMELQTDELSTHHAYRERKCADTIGTVPVLWAGHFQC